MPRRAQSGFLHLCRLPLRCFATSHLDVFQQDKISAYMRFVEYEERLVLIALSSLFVASLRLDHPVRVIARDGFAGSQQH